HRLRESEVEHLNRSVGADLDVCGLQVSMDDRLLMRGFESDRELLRYRQYFGKRHRTARNDLRQVLAVTKLHDELRIGFTGSFKTVDLSDVRMIERSQRLRLSSEAGQPIRIAIPLGRQHLYCDFTMEHRVARTVDDAHAARADRRQDFVRTQARAGL